MAFTCPFAEVDQFAAFAAEGAVGRAIDPRNNFFTRGAVNMQDLRRRIVVRQTHNKKSLRLRVGFAYF